MGQDCTPDPRLNEPGTSDFASGPLTVWPRGSYRPERPFVAHEYLNLSVKLDSRLKKRFTGVWLPPLTRAARAARLDPACDGYSYWSLQDVCVLNKGAPAGQALFDPFWGEKPGGDTVRDVFRYNAPNCVLLRDGDDPEGWTRDPRVKPRKYDLFADAMATNRVRRAGETLRARFLFAHFESDDLASARLDWRLAAADGRMLATGSADLGAQAAGPARPVAAADIVIPALASATRATLSATVRGRAGADAFEQSNAWDYWLFPTRAPRPVTDVACAEAFRPALAARYPGLLGEADRARAKTVIAARGSALEAAALAAGQNVISLSGQTGAPNIFLGWWWMGSQMGSVLVDHPWLDGLPHRGVFTPLLFRIAKEGLTLPVAGVTERDIVMAGEGHEFCYLYLAETRAPAGGRVCHIAGLDVLTDTPEGTAILDGALRRCTP